MPRQGPGGPPSLGEIITLCQAANAETVLRRPEDWLPAPVSADITARVAAPAPAQAPPPPLTAPSAGHPPTAPAAAAPSVGHPPTAPAGAPPATAPAGYGPAAQQPAQVPHPPAQPYQTPAPAPVHPYAPTQFAQPAPAYPGHPGHPGHPVPAPQRRPGAGRRTALLGLAAALVFAVAGAGTAYVLTNGKGDDKGGQASGSSGARQTPGGGDSSQGAPASGGGRPAADPKPAEFKGINLTAGYHLTFSDDTVRPQLGEDGGYELSYDTGSYLDAETTGGTMVLLDPGQEGSLATCRADTRFSKEVYVNKLSKGRQLCVFTGAGTLGLVTVQGFSAEDSPSKYITLDVTVWRNAVTARPSS